MPKVELSHLIGNYGSALVSSRLSSECFVRPVAADTDVGIDLYCETVADGQPFLHFWVQVKAGASQITVSEDGSRAKCQLKAEHLRYWSRQPVPVCVAMVPTSWPVQDEPAVYIADISSLSIAGLIPQAACPTIESDLKWEPDDRQAVVDFLSTVVPHTDARLLCRFGVVGSVKSLDHQYTQAVPYVPAGTHLPQILMQLRRTAAMSIISMWKLRQLTEQTAEGRKRLAQVVAQFSDDGHWENFMALALSAHADGDWDTAVSCYDKALAAVGGDPDFAPAPGIDGLQRDIQEQRSKAASRCHP